ncbi:hypothetical protein NH340_JMT00993 [Sarcoptes scabiei]|nr:hypothetical protein NH340_JMT00993 [Sarcoptes scabiei]
MMMIETRTSRTYTIDDEVNTSMDPNRSIAYQFPKTANRFSKRSEQNQINLTSTTKWPFFWHLISNNRCRLQCFLCGLFASIIGVSMIFLAIFFRANTSSIEMIESLPIYVPGLILLSNGISLLGLISENFRQIYLVFESIQECLQSLLLSN